MHEPKAKQTTRPGQEAEQIPKILGPFAQARHAREEIEGQLAPVTQSLDSYDLGAVARLLLLEEGYKTVCKAVIEAFFIPTIGKNNY